MLPFQVLKETTRIPLPAYPPFSVPSSWGPPCWHQSAWTQCAWTGLLAARHLQLYLHHRLPLKEYMTCQHALARISTFPHCTLRCTQGRTATAVSQQEGRNYKLSFILFLEAQWTKHLPASTLHHNEHLLLYQSMSDLQWWGVWRAIRRHAVYQYVTAPGDMEAGHRGDKSYVNTPMVCDNCPIHPFSKACHQIGPAAAADTCQGGQNSLNQFIQMLQERAHPTCWLSTHGPSGAQWCKTADERYPWIKWHGCLVFHGWQN